MTLSKLKLAFTSLAVAGSVLTGAGVSAYQFAPDSGGKAAAATAPDKNDAKATAPAKNDAEATEKSILVNGGFEQSDNDAFPNNWSIPANPPGVDLGRTHEAAHRGNFSFYFKKTVPGSSPIAEVQQTVVLEDRIPRLKVSAWVKAERLTKAVLDVQFVDLMGHSSHAFPFFLGPKSSGEMVTHDWKLFEGVVAVPPDTHKLIVAPQLYGPGTVWFDDLSAVPTNDPTTDPFKSAPLPSQPYPLSSLATAQQEFTFKSLLGRDVNWDANRIDRLFHWSRALKDSQESLANLRDRPQEVAAARRDHLDRMQRLYAFTQEVKVPDQPKLADQARVYFLEAQRKLKGETEPAKPADPPKPGSNQVPLPADAPKPSANQQAKAAEPGKRVEFVSFGPGGGGGMGGGESPDEEGIYPADRPRLKIAESVSQIVANDKSPKSRAIWKAIDEPISMNFPNETPLEEVLKYIKTEMQKEKGRSIPIYVDPAGLQVAEKTLTSPVTIDLEDVPLKTCLRLILRQLDLAYCVRDGVLIISDPKGIVFELTEAEAAAEDEDKAAKIKPVPAAK